EHPYGTAFHLDQAALILDGESSVAARRVRITHSLVDAHSIRWVCNHMVYRVDKRKQVAAITVIDGYPLALVVGLGQVHALSSSKMRSASCGHVHTSASIPAFAKPLSHSHCVGVGLPIRPAALVTFNSRTMKRPFTGC